MNDLSSNTADNPENDPTVTPSSNELSDDELRAEFERRFPPEPEPEPEPEDPYGIRYTVKTAQGEEIHLTNNGEWNNSSELAEKTTPEEES